jgi:hypothetical protein
LAAEPANINPAITAHPVKRFIASLLLQAPPLELSSAANLGGDFGAAWAGSRQACFKSAAAQISFAVA